MTPTPRRLFLLPLLVSALLLQGCAAHSHGLSYAPTAATQLVDYPLTGNTRTVHDPSLFRQGATWYAFTTDIIGQPRTRPLRIRCSPDLIAWTACGSVFERIPAWVDAKIPGIRDLWAPDITYFGGLYRVYYAGSTTGSQRSVIGMATNTTLDPADPAYRWVDAGQILESHVGDDFNAIDPNILVDPGVGSAGRVWMTYGSYWSGIKQLELDPATGLIKPHARRYNLAARPKVPLDPIEGASMIHHGSFYYLFVSVDFCCNSDVRTDDYKQAMGRGPTPHGPFKDMAGTPMLQGGGTVLLTGNATWNAPGGGTVFVDPDTGETSLIFHALNMQQNGALYLWVKHIDWQNDWPVLAPMVRSAAPQ